jgi:formyl-CoA transferase
MRQIMKQRDLVRGLFAEAFAEMDLQEACQVLDEEALSYSVLERIGEVVESAHLIENEVIVETLSDDPDFRWTIANPIQLGSLKHRRAGDPPRLGEHTRSILATLGYGEDQIEALLNQGIVKVS